MKSVTAFIGLGGNLGEVEATLQSAVSSLAKLPVSRLSGISGLYRSTPLGPPGQNDYLNAVVRLKTTLPPHALLAALQEIENQHGRERQERWGARTLDLDLLLYGNDAISSTNLVVPHPELRNRNFVLIPLLQIAPEARMPDGSLLAMMAAAQGHQGLLEIRSGERWAMAIDAS